MRLASGCSPHWRTYWRSLGCECVCFILGLVWGRILFWGASYFGARSSALPSGAPRRGTQRMSDVLPPTIAAWFAVPRDPADGAMRTEVALVALLLRPFASGTHAELVRGLAPHAATHTMSHCAFGMLLRAHLRYWCNKLTGVFPALDQAAIELLVLETLLLDLREACAD